VARPRGVGAHRVALPDRHADHVAGLVGLVDAISVGRLWGPPHAGDGELLSVLMAQAEAAAIPVEVPEPGWRAGVGAFTIEVLGPLRHYASPNDESIVLMVEAAGSTALLPGDIELVAQGELGPLPADVMKVPHQGAATSDPEWLMASVGSVAVVSVGPNTFGHPSDGVIDLLTASGATVYRTDKDGDVVIRFGSLR
ncbi:MAG: ComEC/Rec2 family competence protein, partial [Acidimicrobiia bacterium]